MKRQSQDMKIADVMTMNPDWCIPQTPATQAARIMKDTNVGIVPVVDSESGRTLVGVVTDRDLCLAVVAMGVHPDSVLVGQAMTSEVMACHPNDKLRKAADVMRDNQIRRVPIVDEQGVLQGMVSTADIIQRSNLSPDLTHHILRKVTEPTEEASRPRAQMKRAA